MTIAACLAETKPVCLIPIAGRPVKEPVARCSPFATNAPEQIVEAIRDAQAGRL
jgi:redox-sensitive bicupin YhaK (pirin superfamily)